MANLPRRIAAHLSAAALCLLLALPAWGENRICQNGRCWVSSCAMQCVNGECQVPKGCNLREEPAPESPLGGGRWLGCKGEPQDGMVCMFIGGELRWVYPNTVCFEVCTEMRTSCMCTGTDEGMIGAPCRGCCTKRVRVCGEEVKE